MRKPRCILVLLVVLGFGLYLAIPAEDVPETAYDESEAVPYESTPLFSIVMPLAPARMTQAVPNSLHPKLGAPSPLTLAHVRDTDANRPVGARISLALLCTLLC